MSGRFLLGATDNGSSGASQAAGNTGGEVSHKHTTSGHALTIKEMPRHNHSFSYTAGSSDGAYGGWSAENLVRTLTSKSSNTDYTGGSSTASSASNGDSHTHGDTGSTTTLPPYLSVYMWKRTA